MRMIVSPRLHIRHVLFIHVYLWRQDRIRLDVLLLIDLSLPLIFFSVLIIPNFVLNKYTLISFLLWSGLKCYPFKTQWVSTFFEMATRVSPLLVTSFSFISPLFFPPFIFFIEDPLDSNTATVQFDYMSLILSLCPYCSAHPVSPTTDRTDPVDH